MWEEYPLKREAEMADRSGQQLGNYQLLRLLGRGGFAEVYLGQHVYLQSLAALKILHIVLNNEDIEGFVKEARTLASLTHPHIIRVLDFAVENGTPFLVMEYAVNGSLRQRHPQGSQLPSETIISYVRQVASALQYAHDQHLIHRDVKPDNMLLGSGNEVLLSDFGLALLSSQSVDFSTQIMEPTLAGTTPYLAPEQLQGKPQPASDQYSLGIVVYEWLCGKRPFNGSPIEVAMQHISSTPTPLRIQVPGISPLVEETVMRSLAKDPQQRFASVQDFATSLERAYRYMLLPNSSFALPEEIEALETILKPGPMWKVPTAFTPLVGRDKEVADVCELLKNPDVHLVTLLGTGGIGKTRLSYQVAREIQSYFTDGVCFVHLATLNEPDLVVPIIAQELGIQEIGAQSIFQQIKVALRNKHFLLLLDNFEQVVATAPLIEELLADCPRLKILVTSREVLRLDAEYVFSVPPLGTPDLNQLLEDEMVTQYSAIALFFQRAQAVLPTFQLTQTNARTIAEICVRLDGLPLAIELAAARIKLLPPQALLARLSQPFQILVSASQTLPARHQTLRNALQWSYDLLEVEEQRLFRRLSAFSGGWTLEAVEALEQLLNEGESSSISVLDHVASLFDKSLILHTKQEGEEPRLIMFVTVGEFALSLLRESHEEEITRRAHARYFLSLVEEAEPHLKGPEQTTWLVKLEIEQENLRAALAWFMMQKDVVSALRFCGSLSRFWYLRGYWSEGRRWLEGALGSEQAANATATRAKALFGAGNLAYYQDDYAKARTLLEESVQIYRQLGIERDYAHALGALGVLVHTQGDHVTAHHYLEESEKLCRKPGSKWELAYLLRKLGFIASREGDLPRAAASAQEGLVLARELGDKSLIAATLLTLGDIAVSQGDLERAVAQDQEGLSLARELGDKSLISIAVQNLGYLAALQGNIAQATVRAQEGLSLARELGDKITITSTLHTLGYLAALRGNIDQASTYYLDGISLALEIGYEKYVGLHLIGLAEVAIEQEQPRRAARLFGVAGTKLDVKVDMNTMERTHYERVVESVRKHLSEKVFTAAWIDGSSMTPEQTLAISEEEPVIQTNVEKALPFAPILPDELTSREVEVLGLVAKGWSDAQIAEHLVISPRTVNTHISSIYRKIQVKSRSAATRYAIEHHLV
jgi:predicted ATPase/DNA-binding CsgD family transcriptional regulator